MDAFMEAGEEALCLFNSGLDHFERYFFKTALIKFLKAKLKYYEIGNLVAAAKCRLYCARIFKRKKRYKIAKQLAEDASQYFDLSSRDFNMALHIILDSDYALLWPPQKI